MRNWFNISKDMQLDEHLHLPKLMHYLAVYLSWIVFITYHTCSVFLLCRCDEKGLLLSVVLLIGFLSCLSCAATPLGIIWGHELTVNHHQWHPSESSYVACRKKALFKVTVSKVKTSSGNTAPWRLGPFTRSSRGKYFISTLADWFCFKRPQQKQTE